jgi:signal transduction histidine kinase
MTRLRDGAANMRRALLPRTRLNRRLLAWFLVFSLVPLIATNAVGYYRSKAIIEDLFQTYLKGIARTQAQHVQDRVERQALALQAIVAGNAFLVAGAQRAMGMPAGEMGSVATRAAMNELLADKRRELGDWAALFLFTPDGRVLAYAGDSARVVPVVVRGVAPPRVTTARAGVTDVPPGFRFIVPLAGHAGEPLAYLGGTMTMDAFHRLLALPPHLAGRTETAIVDQRGRLLYVSHPMATTDYEVPISSPLLRYTAGTVARYVGIEGTPVIGTVEPISGPQWRLVAEVPEGEAFGELSRLGGLSLVLELLLGLALIITAWIVAEDVVAPVSRLVEATRRVGAGDLTTRVLVQTRDETGELGHAFNEMTAALEATTRRVDELHARDMQRAAQLATVGELASGVAHEIRNPVVGVAGGLDLVRRRVGDDPALVPIIDEMSRQLARIRQTLQELLAFARPPVPALATIAVQQLVERAMRLVTPHAEGRGVACSTTQAAEPLLVNADAELLRQALVNLLMNAMDATPPGGEVRVATARDGVALVLTVSDTGKGIAAANLENVFKPFFTTRHTGTGLGLSITRSIVERHGGTIGIASVEGAGTTVTIRLPLAPAGAVASDAPPPEEARP